MIRVALLYLLPYAAIGAGFVAAHSAWVATLLYHGVILVMWGWQRPPLRWGISLGPARLLALMGTCALCLPLIVWLWPWLILPGLQLPAMLDAYGLGEGAWWGFFAYIVLVHPVLEEVYWRGLAPDNGVSDVAFAGFHVILVAPFLRPGWIAAVVAVLIGAGWVWRWTVRRSGGLGPACLTHAVADLGILLALLILR